MFTLFGAKCRIVKIYFVWWGRRKKKGRGYMGGGGKRKNESGVGFMCIVGKKGSGKERKKIERKKNWFYLYVHFVWCKV